MTIMLLVRTAQGLKDAHTLRNAAKGEQVQIEPPDQAALAREARMLRAFCGRHSAQESHGSKIIAVLRHFNLGASVSAGEMLLNLVDIDPKPPRRCCILIGAVFAATPALAEAPPT